jgi:nitrate/nitrite transporter NarK
MMGFAWGMGGLTVPLVGMMADRIGIERALVVLSAMPLIAAVLAIPLPSRKQLHVAPRASDATTAEGIGIDVAD